MSVIPVSESQHQISLFDFLARIEGRLPAVRWAFHVPNGGHRHKAVAGRLRGEGVKAGVPDILLPVAAGSFCGLAIEMKAGRNTVSDTQQVWLDHLVGQGWFCVVCWTWEDAAREVLRYLGADPREYQL